MKRLLMMSYPFPPNASAGAMRSERFARYLPKFGWKADVVTIKPREDLFEDKELLDRVSRAAIIHFTNTLDPWLRLKEWAPENAVLSFGRSASMKMTSFPDHMVFWVPFAVNAGLSICRQKQVDAIYTTSPPHSTHIAGMVLSRIVKKPWVADFRDPWTLNRYREASALDNLSLKFERVMEEQVLKKASTVLANTQTNRKNLLKAFPGIKRNKVVYLPNGWEEFDAADCEVGKAGLFTIVHAGTFYPRFKPYGLLHAIAEWKMGNKPLDIPPLDDRLRIILLGSRDSDTRKVVERLGLQDLVEFKPWIALGEARRIMCRADLLWASLGTGIESSTYVPSKLFEYISAKRPILGFFHEGEAETLIRKTRTGRVFTKDDTGPIIQYLHKAILAKANGQALLYTPSNNVVESLSIKSVVQKFVRCLELLNKRE